MNYRAIEITFENYLDAGYDPYLIMLHPKHKERMNVFVSWDVIDDNTWNLHTVYGDYQCRFDDCIDFHVAVVLVHRHPPSKMREMEADMVRLEIDLHSWDPLPPHLTPRGTVVRI